MPTLLRTTRTRAALAARRVRVGCVEMVAAVALMLASSVAWAEPCAPQLDPATVAGGSTRPKFTIEARQLSKARLESETILRISWPRWKCFAH